MTKTATKAPGAAKRPLGRPPIPVDQRAVVGSIRLTPARWAKLQLLGGAAWISARIDKARTAPLEVD